MPLNKARGVTTVSTDVLPQETPVRANRAGVLYCKKTKNVFQKSKKVLAFYFESCIILITTTHRSFRRVRARALLRRNADACIR